MKKMKMIKTVFLAMLLLASSVGLVEATTYTVDPLIGGHWYTTFLADLDGDGVYDGETADDWSITTAGSYTISVGISDGFLYGDYFDVYLDGGLIGTTPIVAKDGSDGYSSASFDVLLLAATHTVDFVDVLLRDYYLQTGPVGFGGFVDSSYSPAGAYVDISAAQPVPEPSTILLVGTGLLGIIGFGRKRFNKKA